MLVLDSSVVLKWFRGSNEPDHEIALGIRTELEEGDLEVIVPRVFILEMLNVPGRKLHVSEADLHLLADAVAALDFTVIDVDPHAIVRHIAAGLTAYDASYAAVAAAQRVPLVTADRHLADVASNVAIYLPDYRPT